MGVHRFILPLSSIPLSSASFFSLRTITNSSSNVSEQRCLGLGCCRWDGGGGGGGGGGVLSGRASFGYSTLASEEKASEK